MSVAAVAAALANCGFLTFASAEFNTTRAAEIEIGEPGNAPLSAPAAPPFCKTAHIAMRNDPYRNAI